jgi:hypothetical protein
MGGPIKQDKLWFFSAFRWEDRSLYQAGNYYNKRQGTVFYEPDLSRPAYNHDFSKDASMSLCRNNRQDDGLEELSMKRRFCH